MAEAQVKQRRCAALLCRRRSPLIPTKAVTFGLLIEIDLCPDHEQDYVTGLHAAFRDKFGGLDFVDAERN